jgi:hypothetical protein
MRLQPRDSLDADRGTVSTSESVAEEQGTRHGGIATQHRW